MSITHTETVQTALAAIRKTESRTPRLGLILGSGLGHLASLATETQIIATQDIPHYPVSTVVGHEGKLVFGNFAGKEVVLVQGRVHYYEGHSIRAVTFPVRLLHALGVTHLIVTNAAGGINTSFKEGDLMFIHDHINLAFQNPLSGKNEEGGPRFVDMSHPYDEAWRLQAEQIALQLQIPTRTGTYIWVSGPSYETKAEIRFFRKIGADAVGMSTVPEVLQARYFNMKVLGISSITNLATDLQGAPLEHEDVIKVGNAMKTSLSKLVSEIVSQTAI